MLSLKRWLARWLYRCALYMGALLLLTTAAHAGWRDCKVESATGIGSGYRIGGGLVLTAAHVLCNTGRCALVAEVNGHSAKVLARGQSRSRNATDDDGSDWGLLYCSRYKSDPPVELRPPAEGETYTYRGKRAQVRAISSGGTVSFDGDPLEAGDSGSGFTDGTALYGIGTSYNDRRCTCGDCPAGWFCAVSEEIIAAVKEARDGSV